MIKSREIPKDSSGEKRLEVIIDNGDYELVKSLTKAYSLKDTSSLFKFALASLLQANNNEGLFTVKSLEDGKRVLSGLTPSEEMLEVISEDK